MSEKIQGRRVKHLLFDAGVLVEMFQPKPEFSVNVAPTAACLPEDAAVLAVYPHWDSNCLCLKVESQSYDLVPPGEVPPYENLTSKVQRVKPDLAPFVDAVVDMNRPEPGEILTVRVSKNLTPAQTSELSRAFRAAIDRAGIDRVGLLVIDERVVDIKAFSVTKGDTILVMHDNGIDQSSLQEAFEALAKDTESKVIILDPRVNAVHHNTGGRAFDSRIERPAREAAAQGDQSGPPGDRPSSPEEIPDLTDGPGRRGLEPIYSRPRQEHYDSRILPPLPLGYAFERVPLWAEAQSADGAIHADGGGHAFRMTKSGSDGHFRAVVVGYCAMNLRPMKVLRWPGYRLPWLCEPTGQVPALQNGDQVVINDTYSSWNKRCGVVRNHRNGVVQVELSGDPSRTIFVAEETVQATGHSFTERP